MTLVSGDPRRILINYISLYMEPAEYEAWYHTPRGAGISATEFALMRRLLQPHAGERLLDVGCGTGHFTRQFAQLGLEVTGLDPDPAMLEFAQAQNQAINYQAGKAEALPFMDGSFDYVTAITSLCFVAQPEIAIQEMWRVCRRSLLLGLLNRHSLLYRQKANRGGYRGARWDRKATVTEWIASVSPPPQKIDYRSCVFLLDENQIQRVLDRFIPTFMSFGAFLLVKLSKRSKFV